MPTSSTRSSISWLMISVSSLTVFSLLLRRLRRGNARLDGADRVPGGDFAQLRENGCDLGIKHSTRTVVPAADMIAAVAIGATVPTARYAGAAPAGRRAGSLPPRPSSMPIAVDGGLI